MGVGREHPEINVNRSNPLIAFLSLGGLAAVLATGCGEDGKKNPSGVETGLAVDADSGQGFEPGEDTAEVDAEYSYACSAIGSSYSDGFFALQAFSDQLYAGLFGYGHESQSMLYRYPDFGLVSPGLTGISESVCAMREYQGALYANTESSGDIFRSTDGAAWTQVYDGDDHTIGCGLEAFGDDLYAVNYDNRDKQNGRILRSSGGASWETVWDSGSDSWYLREITSHDGVLYAFAVDESDLQGWMLASTDGNNWTATPTQTRFFRAHSWGEHLWLASTDRSSDGGAGIWRYDGAQITQVHQESKHYVTEITDFNGALFAGTSDGWKTDEGSSSLLMSEDGESWETVCTFPEIAAWSIAVLDDHLYVGTWEYGAGGQLYQVEAAVVAQPSGRCEDAPKADDSCAHRPIIGRRSP
jgi:hypothetical protein